MYLQKNKKLMAPLRYIPFLIFSIVLFSPACYGQTSNNNTDTSHYKVDSTFSNVMIDKKFFAIQILRNTNDDAGTDKNRIGLVIKDRISKKPVYKKYFVENKYNIFKTTSDHLNKYGKLFFEAISEGGGSGFSGKCFVIASNNNVISLIPAYTFDELSLLYFIGDTTIIKLQGTWNFKEEEAHFSNHRYILTRYDYAGGKFSASKLGSTKFKYESMDANISPKKVLLQIKKKEPELVQSLQLE